MVSLFSVSLRKTVTNLIYCTVINKSDEGAIGQISTVFDIVYHVTCRRVLWNGAFRHLSEHVFHSP